ncbi:MAG: hypothetical protein ACTSUE_27640 [Promethearchaeota archaeon]
MIDCKFFIARYIPAGTLYSGTPAVSRTWKYIYSDGASIPPARGAVIVYGRL